MFPDYPFLMTDKKKYKFQEDAFVWFKESVSEITHFELVLMLVLCRLYHVQT